MTSADRYQQTVTELFELQKFAIKLGLDNIRILSGFLNNPHLSYPVIHIAGTNGKGSTAFYLSQLLQACGLRVGLYTSPHLNDYRERIRINNLNIDAESVITFWDKIKTKVLERKATFFDTTTLLATNYFAEQKVDAAVIETGLGGRLDSTNIVKPDSVIITPIGFDHQQHLGNTLKKITFEKAGIIKPDCDVFLTKFRPALFKVLSQALTAKNRVFQLTNEVKIRIDSADIAGVKLRLKIKPESSFNSFYLPGPAIYQSENFALAYLTFTKFCEKHKIRMPNEDIATKIAQSSWPGRLQIIQRHPDIIFDVSHNLPGIKTTLQSVLKFADPKKTHLLLGILNDKDVKGITKILSGKFKNIIVTEPNIYRKQNAEVLVNAFKANNENVKLIKDLNQAFEKSKNYLKDDETLLVLGSHYLIGELISI